MKAAALLLALAIPGVAQAAIEDTLGLGPRSCGVLRLRGGEMVAWYVKAENEVEGVVGEVRLCAGGRTIEGRGDFCSG